MSAPSLEPEIPQSEEAAAPRGLDPDRGASDPVAAWVLGAALVIGAVRFLGLGQLDWWIDELLTWSDMGGGQAPSHNPLGYRLVGGVAELLGGPGAQSLRLLPALAGWACIPLTAWCLSPRLGRRVCAFGALFVALSPWHVFWSQSARFYTLAQAGGLLGVGWALRSGLSTRWVGLLSGSLVAFAAAALCHPTALTLLPAAAILSVPDRPRFRRASWLALGVALLLASPWAYSAWREFANEGKTVQPLHFTLTVGAHLTPLLAVAALLGLITGWRKELLAPRLALAIVAVGLPVLVASLFVRASAQYVFVGFPLVALAAALLVGRPTRGSAGHGLTALSAGILVALSLGTALGVRLFMEGGGRPPYRAALERVAAELEPGDLLYATVAPAAEAHLGARGLDPRLPRHVVWGDPFRGPVLTRWSRRDRRTWALVRPEYLEEFEPAARRDLEALLAEEFRLVQFFPRQELGRDLSLALYLRD